MRPKNDEVRRDAVQYNALSSILYSQGSKAKCVRAKRQRPAHQDDNVKMPVEFVRNHSIGLATEKRHQYT